MRAPLNIAAVLAISSFPGTSGQSSTTIGGLSGRHTDIPRWCGKPYEAGSPNFDPGGRIELPIPSVNPEVRVRIRSRHSIYDSSEDTGAFIVELEDLGERERKSTSHASQWACTQWHQHGEWNVQIRLTDTPYDFVSNATMADGTTNEIPFSFDNLEARLQPYTIQLSASPSHRPFGPNLTASASLYYLPAKNTGSTVKIDNLYHAMLVSNNATNYTFQPFFPFGFYTSCSGYLNYSLANVTAYKNLGFNAINPVCAFTDGDLNFLFDWLDSSNLWYQYDMRSSYQNLSEVADQIEIMKDRSNLLSWYTADEPDGWQYALNSTKLTYDLLKERDPYHPTGLVLNCQNYYFEEYTSGTDYIMQDTYPVGIDPTYSREFDTPCNATYGDCGCDNCLGSLRDVSDRLDDFRRYQNWLGGTAVEKPLWSTLQAFSGESYWVRDPSVEETWVMVILSLNHGAKGVMSWLFPTSEVLGEAHGEIAKVVTGNEVSRFLMGGNPVAFDTDEYPILDVAYWVLDKEVMVAVANVANTSFTGSVEIRLPVSGLSIVSQAWGSLPWSLKEGADLSIDDLPGLTTSIVILSS